MTVTEGASPRPLFVTILRMELNVGAIDRQWQEDAEPWEHKLVSRIHYKVTLEDCPAPDGVREHGPRLVISPAGLFLPLLPNLRQ